MRVIGVVGGIVVGVLALLGIWWALGDRGVRDPLPAVARGAAAETLTPGALPPDTQGVGATVGAGGMTYIYDAPETESDVRYKYHWAILQSALEHTKGTWGDYRMAPASVAMTERRQAAELKAGSGKLTVMYLGTTKVFEEDLIPVKIPVDRDLGGYMVMLIRKEEQARFSAVRTLDDLKQFRIGLGLGWVDVGILQHSGLQVETGSNYDGLFDMLMNKRFDAFSRAAVEIGEEFDQRKERMPEMAIETSMILYYRLPMYFWFPKTAEGRRLADRAREGMLAMYDDGSYMQIFNKYQQAKITRLELSRRHVIEIPNQNLDGLDVPVEDKRLWFENDPAP